MDNLSLETAKQKEKLFKKLHKALLNIPTKRVEVIRSLFKSFSPKTKVSSTEHNIVPYNTLSQETMELVASFYVDDSISRVLPGKKDVISTKHDHGTKEKKRKKLLLDDISNVYRKYLEEHPDHPIGKSKFFQLRPLWVIPVNKQSQEVCKCIYHENIDMICTSLINKARLEKLKTDYKILQMQIRYGKRLYVIFKTKIVFCNSIKTAVQKQLKSSTHSKIQMPSANISNGKL